MSLCALHVKQSPLIEERPSPTIKESLEFPTLKGLLEGFPYLRVLRMLQVS